MDRPSRLLCGFAALAGLLLASVAFSVDADAQTRKPRAKAHKSLTHGDVRRPPAGLRRMAPRQRFVAAPRGPRPLVIRPTLRRAPVPAGGYLCPRPGDFEGRCTSVRRAPPVRLEGQGSETSILGSAKLSPPRVPPVEPTQTGQPYLLRSDPRIGFAANVDFGPAYYVVPPFRPLSPSLSIQPRP